MTHARPRLACFAALLIVVPHSLWADEHPRRTPIVAAVEKTREGVVTIRVEKPNSSNRDKESFGTGVIVDDRGYVLTNHHVVASATSVVVYLVNGTRFSARILAKDPNTDLAILRIVPEKKDGTLPRLQALPIGPGADLMVGESVIAVGSPYGYTHTVSTGIVSALGREISMPSGELLRNLIQTNASINPGNSGGPLLNINGEVIGINVALRQGAQGIAFAINADTVKSVLSRHLSALKVAGIQHGMICSERIDSDGPDRQRVVVSSVMEQTPAAAAGVELGDEIRRVGSRSVVNRFDLERAMWDRKPGDEVLLAVVRRGREMTLPIKLTASQEDKPVTTSVAGKKPPGVLERPAADAVAPANR